MISTKKLIYKVIEFVSKKPTTYDTLVNSASVSAGNVTLYSDRKFSDYTLILCIWIVNSSIRASLITSRSAFTQMSYAELFYVDSQNTQRWADVKYVDDTTANLTASANASGTMLVLGVV